MIHGRDGEVLIRYVPVLIPDQHLTNGPAHNMSGYIDRITLKPVKLIKKSPVILTGISHHFFNNITV